MRLAQLRSIVGWSDKSGLFDGSVVIEYPEDIFPFRGNSR
jgi:hypothetical protein